MKTEQSTQFELDSRIAGANRSAFALDGVTAVSLVGPPGAGKTAVIQSVAHELHVGMRIGAIIGNPASMRDAERLGRHGVRSAAVQTDNLSPTDVQDSLAALNLARIDLVFIESAGSKLSPVKFDLGEDLRVAVFSVAGGDDKAAEYERLVAESDLVLLTGVDLLPFIEFDMAVFTADIERAHAGIKLMHFSSRTGSGLDAFIHWLANGWSPDKRFLQFGESQKSECFYG